MAAGRWAFIALGAGLCRAWGPKGHERIFHIAQALLPESSPKYPYKAWLKGSFEDLHTWEQEATSKHPETNILHWHHQVPEWTCHAAAQRETGDMGSWRNKENPDHTEEGHIGDLAGHVQCDGHGAESGSLFCALAFFFEHFAHAEVLQNYPPPKDPINAPEELAALKNVDADEQMPEHYLRWILILLADLHQPLHWLQNHGMVTGYGQSAKVTYQGQEFSLLEFWENEIPKRFHPMRSPESLKQQYDDRLPGWQGKLPTELFREWAKEHADVVCHQVYAAMEVGKGEERHVQTPYEVNEDVFQRWLELANELAELAGQRVAWLLMDLLEHRRHKLSHKLGKGRLHHKVPWMNHAQKNFLIGIIVVPSLLFGIRFLDYQPASKRTL
jgi:hypothetical protein